jgi:MATE family multidrug resistance protein
MLREVRAMFSLAWPVILTEVGWMMMGVVDTIAVGPLGPAAIGAVGTGSGIFFALMVLGIGTLFALDTFVAQGFGGGRVQECHRWLVAGLWLAVLLSVGLMAAGALCVALLPTFGMAPEVSDLLAPYLAHLLWSVPPLLLYSVFRRYLQAMHQVKPIVIAIVAANVVNAVANWVLIYGHFGFPAFGVVGAAWATLASRVVLMMALWWVVVRSERIRPSGLHDVPFGPDVDRIWRLARHGLPAAFQVMLEVGVFAVAGVLAARISPAAAGAHQVALQIAGFFFMVPLGLSSAAAVRVGHAVGRGDAAAARLAGWTAVALALAVAACVATLLLVMPQLLLGIFTDDPALLAMGATLLIICAAFQPFDAAQSVATGALRGWGDTTTPAVLNLAGHWLAGLPLGYVLCFTLGWGLLGLWIGLATGLTLVGVSVVVAWRRLSVLPLALVHQRATG